MFEENKCSPQTFACDILICWRNNCDNVKNIAFQLIEVLFSIGVFYEAASALQWIGKEFHHVFSTHSVWATHVSNLFTKTLAVPDRIVAKMQMGSILSVNSQW